MRMFLTKILVAVAAACAVVSTALPAGAQWRATAWTMDLKNDTDMCLLVTAGFPGDPPIDSSVVWAGRSQHFDDNHTTLVVHAKVYEKKDCSGKFVADLSDNVIQIRNVLTIYKDAGTYKMRREKHW